MCVFVCVFLCVSLYFLPCLEHPQNFKEVANTPENAHKIAKVFNELRAKYKDKLTSTGFRRELRKWFVCEGYEQFRPENEAKDKKANNKAFKRATKMYFSRDLACMPVGNIFKTWPKSGLAQVFQNVPTGLSGNFTNLSHTHTHIFFHTFLHASPGFGF